MEDRFGLKPDGGNGRAGADLHHGQFRLAFAKMSQPHSQPHLLVQRAGLSPGKIAEHHHVGSSQRATMRTKRQRPLRPKQLLVQNHVFVDGVPNGVAARFGALEMVDGTVALRDLFRGKSRLLKLAVHVGGKNEIAVRFARSHLEQPPKSVVRNGRPVKVQPMAVKSPGEFGRFVEPFGIGHLRKIQTQFGDGWVGLPESLSSPEVGEAGIDAHARAGSDQQGVGVTQSGCSPGDDRGKRSWIAGHDDMKFIRRARFVSVFVRPNLGLSFASRIPAVETVGYFHPTRRGGSGGDDVYQFLGEDNDFLDGLAVGEGLHAVMGQGQVLQLLLGGID